jgi:hypothetical protein
MGLFDESVFLGRGATIPRCLPIRIVAGRLIEFWGRTNADINEDEKVKLVEAMATSTEYRKIVL